MSRGIEYLEWFRLGNLTVSGAGMGVTFIQPQWFKGGVGKVASQRKIKCNYETNQQLLVR